MAQDVFSQLARKLRGMAREQAQAERRELERWDVLSLNPLTAGSPTGDIIAASTDPDFHLASRVVSYNTLTGIQVGDVLIVSPHGDDEWTVLDIEAA